MPKPIGYKPTEVELRNLSNAIKAAYERKRLGLVAEKPRKSYPKRERVTVGGRSMIRPEPSDEFSVVLTVAEWKTALQSPDT